MDTISLKFYHGGVFKKGENGLLLYYGGLYRTFAVDPDELCWFYLKELVDKCGVYTGEFKLCYLMPGLDLDTGLRTVYDDNEVREMGAVALQSRCLELYVVHDDYNPDFLSLVKTSQSGSSIGQPISKAVEARRPQKLTPRRSSRLNKESNELSDNLLSVSENTKNSNPTVVPTEKNKKKATSKPKKGSSVAVNLVPSTPLIPENPTQTQTTPTEAATTSYPQEYFVTAGVPDDYDWEDPRPESPIPMEQLLYDGDLSGGEWDSEDYENHNLSGEQSDPDYVAAHDIDYNEYETEEDDWLADYQIYEASFGPDGEAIEEEDLDDLREPEVLDVDTSDDEQIVARDLVKGYNCSIIELAHKLQVEAAEGNLNAQREEGSTVREGNNVSEYEDTDDDIHTPPPSDEDITVQERTARRGLVVGRDTDYSKFEWKIGQRFTSREHFKQALAKFAIYQGRNLCVVAANKNRQQRIGVKCKQGCPFWLYASWDSRRGSFVVKAVRGEHTCLRNMDKNIQLKCTWLADQLLDVFKARPHWPANEIIETVRRAYRVIVKRDFAYKVKWYAHKKLHGSMREHYGKLGRYLEALKAACPATDVELVTYQKNNKGPLIFQRLYICFDGLRKGWKEGCRKIICVDACFLKTFLGGQLMSAVGRDGNDQMYPIAWAVVEGENNESWEWFMLNLRKSLSLDDGEGLVIVSDEHQSIIRGVSTVLPKAEHRHCARHIYANWKQNYKGDEFKMMFWICAKSYSQADYLDAVEVLSKANTLAAEAFNAYNPAVFCRAFMKTDVKTDVLTSNMAETFNGYIINARAKHLIYMLEDIRAALMKRLVSKRDEMMKWSTTLCPRVVKKLMHEKEEAAKCDVLPSTPTVFQVNYHLDSLKVDLNGRTCTCRKWDLTGIPCCHAVAAIFFIHKNAEDFVDEAYTVAQYTKAYASSIPPIDGERHWPRTEFALDPPPIKVGPGRPRRNRKKNPFEDPKKPGKLSKHGMEMTCTVCKEKGHNKRGCPHPGKATLPPTEPPAKRPRGRPKKTTVLQEQPMPQTIAHHTATAEPSRLGRGGRVLTRGGASRGARGGTSTGRGRVGGRGGDSGVRGGSSGGRGSRGGRRGGRSGISAVPHGCGVFVTPDGTSSTNVLGCSAPTEIPAKNTTYSFSFSQGSTSAHDGQFQ